jgi:DNA repair exonuclease SbcCD ATPase subunit
MREFLKGLDLDKETIDTIMAEHGKLITESKEKISELEGKVKTYETKVSEMDKQFKDSQKIQEELNTLKQTIADKEAEEKKKQEEQTFNEEFNKLIGDKQFINEYTKQAIINEFKTALSNEANKGKEKLDVLNEITKDKEGIFSSPNKAIDIPPAGEVNKSETDKKEIPILW